MATRRRPTLYSLEATGRRWRPRTGVPKWVLGVVVLASLALSVSVYAVWRVLPLTDRGAGVIPAGMLPPTAPPGGQTAGALPALSSDQAGSGPIGGVRAAAGIVVDYGTGKVLWMHRPHERRPVASLTKLMTALIAADGHHLRQRFRITAAMTGAPGFTANLKPGDRVTVREMLAGSLIASANDAADALAVQRAGSVRRFVRLMNARAATLGLADTHYSNPSGIVDLHNHSSAWDVALLSRQLLQVPELAHLVGSKLYITGPTSQFVSRNKLLWTYPGAIGIKTGLTAASGACIAAAATHGKHTLVAVLLGTRGDEFAAASRLLDWGFAHDRP